MTKRIAFIKLGSFSHINRNLIAQLQRAFPEHTIDVFDVQDIMLRDHKRLALQFLNLPWLAREYGLQLLQRKKRLRDCLLITSFMFKQIARVLRAQIDPRRYEFSFQTQSLFDASQPGLPHFVYTDHTVLANLRYPRVDQAQALYANAWIAQEATIYRHATTVFAASQFAADSIIEDYACPAQQVVCAYTGVNIAEPDASQPKDYRHPEILFVGVEWERKGGPQLIEAFKQVQATRPDARLTIIGCQPELEPLPNVDIIGKIPPEQLPPFYHRASVFCLPAWIEPAGIAYSEAALYRLPVVATAVGGIPDRVVDGVTGKLGAPGDVPALTAALLHFLNNPEAAQACGEAGRQRALELFLWERVGDVLTHNITAHVRLAERGAAQ